MQRKKIKTKNLEIDSKKAKKFKIAIIASNFNADITDGMVAGAVAELRLAGLPAKNISLFRVPGSLEIPLVCKKLAISKKYDGLVAIGAVIKGETDHYYYVAGEAARGLIDVGLETLVPIGFGIITTNNLKQARERSMGKNNKGNEAARAVLEVISLDLKGD